MRGVLRQGMVGAMPSVWVRKRGTSSHLPCIAVLGESSTSILIMFFTGTRLAFKKVPRETLVVYQRIE